MSQRIDQVNVLIRKLINEGSIIDILSSSNTDDSMISDKFKLCNGQTLLQEDYVNLFNSISHSFYYPDVYLKTGVLTNVDEVRILEFAKTSTSVVAIRSDGWIYRTTDIVNYKNWALIKSPVDSLVSIAGKYSSNIYVAVSSDGKIIRSVDSGASWVIVDSTIYNYIKIIYSDNDAKFVALANDYTSLISYSTNDGTSWTTYRTSIAPCNDISTLYYNSTNRYMITGKSGTIGFSSDITSDNFKKIYLYARRALQESPPVYEIYVYSFDIIKNFLVTDNQHSHMGFVISEESVSAFSLGEVITNISNSNFSVYILDTSYFEEKIKIKNVGVYDNSNHSIFLGNGNIFLYEANPVKKLIFSYDTEEFFDFYKNITFNPRFTAVLNTTAQTWTPNNSPVPPPSNPVPPPSTPANPADIGSVTTYVGESDRFFHFGNGIFSRTEYYGHITRSDGSELLLFTGSYKIISNPLSFSYLNSKPLFTSVPTSIIQSLLDNYPTIGDSRYLFTNGLYFLASEVSITTAIPIGVRVELYDGMQFDIMNPELLKLNTFTGTPGSYGISNNVVEKPTDAGYGGVNGGGNTGGTGTFGKYLISDNLCNIFLFDSDLPQKDVEILNNNFIFRNIFVGNNNIACLGNNLKIFYSNDQGENFTTSTISALNGYNGNIDSGCFIPYLNKYIVTSGEKYFTGNSLSSWDSDNLSNVFPSISGSHIKGFLTNSVDTTIAFGENGKIYKCGSNINLWTLIGSGTTNNINSGVFYNDGVNKYFILFCDGGVVLKSIDNQGVSYTDTLSGAFGDFYGSVNNIPGLFSNRTLAFSDDFIFVTYDAANKARTTNPYNIRYATYNGYCYFGIGKGKLYSSLDGLSWISVYDYTLSEFNKDLIYSNSSIQEKYVFDYSNIDIPFEDFNGIVSTTNGNMIISTYSGKVFLLKPKYNLNIEFQLPNLNKNNLDGILKIIRV